MDESINSKGRAVPLVSYKDKQFIVEKEAEDILRNSEHKTLGIISLVGKYRTGKSFLLNRVLLNNSQKGFGVGPTIKPCTKVCVHYHKGNMVMVRTSHYKRPKDRRKHGSFHYRY